MITGERACSAILKQKKNDLYVFLCQKLNEKLD